VKWYTRADLDKISNAKRANSLVPSYRKDGVITSAFFFLVLASFCGFDRVFPVSRDCRIRVAAATPKIRSIAALMVLIRQILQIENFVGLHLK